MQLSKLYIPMHCFSDKARILINKSNIYIYIYIYMKWFYYSVFELSSFLRKTVESITKASVQFSQMLKAKLILLLHW